MTTITLNSTSGQFEIGGISYDPEFLDSIIYPSPLDTKLSIKYRGTYLFYLGAESAYQYIDDSGTHTGTASQINDAITAFKEANSGGGGALNLPYTPLAGGVWDFNSSGYQHKSLELTGPTVITTANLINGKEGYLAIKGHGNIFCIDDRCWTTADNASPDDEQLLGIIKTDAATPHIEEPLDWIEYIPDIPAAPTAPVADDIANTENFTNTAGYTSVSDYEFDVNGGPITTLTAKPFSVGNVDALAGAVRVRVKANLPTHTASDWLLNTVAYTVNDTTAPTVTFVATDAHTIVGTPNKSCTGDGSGISFKQNGVGMTISGVTGTGPWSWTIAETMLISDTLTFAAVNPQVFDLYSNQMVDSTGSVDSSGIGVEHLLNLGFPSGWSGAPVSGATIAGEYVDLCGGNRITVAGTVTRFEIYLPVNYAPLNLSLIKRVWIVIERKSTGTTNAYLGVIDSGVVSYLPVGLNSFSVVTPFTVLPDDIVTAGYDATDAGYNAFGVTNNPVSCVNPISTIYMTPYQTGPTASGSFPLDRASGNAPQGQYPPVAIYGL